MSQSGASTKCGDYQYKGCAGREIDPGLEAGRRSRALPGSSSGSSPYLHNYCCLQHTVAPLPEQEGPLSSGVFFFLNHHFFVNDHVCVDLRESIAVHIQSKKSEFT